MLTRHSLSLTVSNLNLVIKVFVYTLLLLLICAAIFEAISTPVLEALNENVDIGEELLKVFKSITDSEVDSDLEFDAIYGDLTHFVNTHSPQIVRACIWYVVLFFIFRFALAYSMVPLSFVLYNKMSSNFNSGFINALVATFAKASLFALLFALITVPLDTIILLLAFLLLKALLPSLGIFGLTIAVGVTLILLSLRAAIFGRWIPAMVSENIKVVPALKQNFVEHRAALKGLFPTYLLLSVVLFTILMTTSLVTLFIAPIAVFPAALVFAGSANMVSYFGYKKQRFYIDERVVG